MTARAYVVTAAVCGLLAAVPFLAVTFPPITDLPQQVAQLRILGEALAGADDYRVQWLHPNKLGYLPLALGWWAGGPLAAGRLGLAVLAVLWVAAVFALARATGRPPAAAILAAVFFFSHPTYWGFLNFLIGFPAFVAWYLLVARLGPRVTWRAGTLIVAASFLLYSAHVLWLAVAAAWLVVASALDRRPAAEIVRRVLWLLPVLSAAAVWYFDFTASGMDERTFWGRPPWVRLSPAWMLPAVLGGLKGGTEAAVVLAVLGWCLLGLVQHRRELAKAGEIRLALVGVAFFVAALALPEVHRHTIFFAARWVPAAAVFLVLACPSPKLRPAFANGVAALVLVTFVTATAAAWMGFEQEELEGLPESLEALPAEPTVLGLDLVRTSPRIHSFPTYHLFAYAQALRGGELNRSFADDASSLVVFPELPRDYPWTDRLDWRPERFRESDRDFFDYVLVHAGPDGHGFFLRDPALELVTEERPWRLYRVR
jgi:catechol 2,3-dioxygenase-like lactoylglutathione lyase family enzyme